MLGRALPIWRRCLVRLVAVAVVALAASGAAISYTVQVIAVSDQETALGISRDLLRDGYPAYVVRSTGAMGDVYRVRVGAFANRAAALWYAESMPEVGGSRPVPALAEAIPQGIMPLAPRLVWHAEWGNEDVRVLPWPGGVAVRLQRGDPLRQARYVVVQDGEVREVDAWLALPLVTLPEVEREPEIDVPMIDLTRPPEPEAESEPTTEAIPAEEPAEAVPVPAGEPDEVPGDAPADEPVAAPDDAPGDAPVDEAETTELPAPEDVAAAVLPDVLTDLGVRLAEPDAAVPEAGLLLLRDRWLWPPTWEDDPAEDVREAFRASLVAVVARSVQLAPERVDALAYFPGGEPPPALVVLDLSDPSGRDAGRVVAVGDMSAGLRPSGPPRLLPEDHDWTLPSWTETRVVREPPGDDVKLGGGAWVVSADGDFTRILLPDGATWRAGVGAPLWSDGRFVVAWDGERILLYDFVVR